MKDYELLVMGNGSGGIVANAALAHGKEVALIDKPPIGGTCQNFGCIPSKSLIYPADRVQEIRESDKFGIKASIEDIDFQSIMAEMRRPIKQGQERQEKALNRSNEIDYYKAEGHFIDNHTVEVNSERMTADDIVIATGARPLIPPINGLEDVNYLTNESFLELQEKPESMIIIGGGYIALELGHFLDAMGTEVTIVERNSRILKNLDVEISQKLSNEIGERINILTDKEVYKVEEDTNEITVYAEGDNDEVQLEAQELLVATGRKSNADLVKIKNTDIEVDDRNYIEVDDYLETNVDNVWALGDALGKAMFKHVANREARYVFNNCYGEKKVKMDYSTVPYAVFTRPQIASVGLTQKEANENFDIAVGKTDFSDVAMGDIMKEKGHFAKAIVNMENMQILGFHIIGARASILIQEVVDLMALSVESRGLSEGMHVHPALPEVISRTMANLREV